MPFTYHRTIRFQETDAAGVVYFANLLVLCHEAYEASLQSAGVPLKSLFSQAGDVAVPIVHTAADFYQPMFCGDRITIELTPKLLSPHSFEIAYRVLKADTALQPLAVATTRHVCISLRDRRRQNLTTALADWIEGFEDSSLPGVAAASD